MKPLLPAAPLTQFPILPLAIACGLLILPSLGFAEGISVTEIVQPGTDELKKGGAAATTVVKVVCAAGALLSIGAAAWGASQKREGTNAVVGGIIGVIICVAAYAAAGKIGGWIAGIT